MNIRLRFKLIALLITLSLAGLVVFQGYWLYGLYRTLYTQMEVNVKEAMKIADYKEVFLRIREQKRKEKNTDNTQIVTYYSDPQSALANDSTTEHTPPGSSRLKIDYSDEDDTSPVDSTLTDYLSTLNSLELYIQQAFHDKVDSVIPIEFHNYSKFLKEELKARNIDSEYQLIVAYHPEDRQKLKGRMNLDNNRKRSSSPILEEDFNQWKSAASFEYPILTDQTLSYRLYLRHPAGIVLGQMSGILASSVLLFVLIVVSFVYLLRTILRQKTVEELKTDFTNNMTHELKTPISVCFAATDALLNFGDPVSEKQRNYLTIVKDQLMHLTGLVEQILTLAVENRSTFRLRPEQVDITNLFSLLSEQYKLKANKKVSFTTDVPDGMEITADRTHLYNMLSNLMENAIKYCDKEQCTVILKAEQDAYGIKLSVSDNGIGIPEAYLKHIFDKFFRIPNGNLHNVKGYGLGLYYVKDMMDRHGGFISVTSHPGKGSDFTLHFPN